MVNASKYVEVLGSKLHYTESGQGNPILFIHGIPTSSYLWRNITPHLSGLGRCIAVDLIGFGKSDKPDIKYSVFDHFKYLDAFIEALKLKNITFVMHGWGSVIGVNYAMNHEKNCKGLIFYEPFLRTNLDGDVSLPFQEQMNGIREKKNMQELVMNTPFFVDTVLPQNAMQPLNENDMRIYREPFSKPGSGKPILQYLEELSADDNKVNQLIFQNTKKLTQSKLPKLILYSVPGFVTTMSTVIWSKDHLPNVEVIDIGEELHLAQESCASMMGEAMSVWLQGIE